MEDLRIKDIASENTDPQAGQYLAIDSSAALQKINYTKLKEGVIGNTALPTDAQTVTGGIAEIFNKLPWTTMQCGTTGSVSAPANSNTDTNVTFSPAFSTTPKLICTMRASNAGGSNFTTQRIYGLSSTGFTARVNNSAGSTTYTVYFDWIAWV